MGVILTHFKIYDPLNDPNIFDFAVKALKLGFGAGIEVKRTGFIDDYYNGCDLIVVRVKEEITVQAKTSSYKTNNRNNLKVHLNYETKAGYKCGFDLYHEGKKIKYFLFIWPNSNCALLTTFEGTMGLWKQYAPVWKRNNNHCDNGCYVALKVSYFINLLGKDNYRMYKIKDD